MTGYISREYVLKCMEDSYKNAGISGEAASKVRKWLYKAPAADVMEVDVKDLRVKKAIQTLCEFYSTAKKSDYVQQPLAWALYQTWRTFNEMDGGVNDGCNETD